MLHAHQTMLALSHNSAESHHAAVAALKRSAVEVAGLLRVLSNADRLLLLCHLAEGECCVGSLSEQTQIVQPSLSQQLTVLRNAGVVLTRREGKRIFYRISDARTLTLMQTLHALYCAPQKRTEGTTKK
jgi:DNA-binding transcriptional ArsR family regulator